MVDTNEGWRSRIVGHDSVPPSELTANPRNWRKHPKAQQQALADVLDRVGWVQDVIVNKRTGLLVDGHARLELALRRGEESVPVVYVDLEPDEEALVLATLDPLSAMAEADDEALRALMADVVADGALAGMLAELAGTTEPKAGKTDPDDVPNIDDVAIYVNRGDIYRLGDHRLMCGDSTTGDVGVLMDGDLADLVCTDPPYGVAVASRVGTRSRSSAEARSEGAAGIQNDEMDVEALTGLLRASFGLALRSSRPGAVWYVTAPHGPIGLAFSVVLAELGIWRHSLVWVKDSLVLSRMDYHYRHEPIYYGWSPGGAHHSVPSRDQDSVWEIPRPKRSLEHPTMKPVALFERAIQNSTDPSAIVLDPFGGSGTTLISCEALGRRARVLELDPKYAQVAIERWEQFTGKKAEKVNAPQLET